MHLKYHGRIGDYNARPPSGGVGAPEEIEVTSDMLDAGYAVYVDQRFALEAGEIGAPPLLMEIFRAMALARQSPNE